MKAFKNKNKKNKNKTTYTYSTCTWHLSPDEFEDRLLVLPGAH